jgi:hypothetical protein
MTRAGVQLAFAALVALGGAWLVGWWLVGLVLIVIASCVAVDAVLRDDGRNDVAQAKHQLADEVLERYRRAR